MIIIMYSVTNKQSFANIKQVFCNNYNHLMHIVLLLAYTSISMNKEFFFFEFKKREYYITKT